MKGKVTMQELTRPQWMLPKGGMDEVLFCDELVCNHPMAYSGGHFFTKEGMVRDQSTIRKLIYDEICPFFSYDLARRVDRLMLTLRMRCQKEELSIKDALVNTANGTWTVDGTFTEDKRICRNRLPVAYNPNAPEPGLWKQFLSDLLEPEDILTLQEFIGYCLIPTNVAQKMLIITGRGGEGKSRIGIVMRGLLGVNMNNGSLTKVECSPFARADLEHKLLMVDDDLNLEALKKTNNIKTIITAEAPMDLERKGQQSYQGTLYCRFMAFGNDSLQALHDRSHGFFRRQIILSAKERDPDRVDDPYLAQRLQTELEGILLWAMEGLQRLFEKDFQFTLSEKALENMRQSISRGNNIGEFMDSSGYIRLDPLSMCSSRSLYNTYRDWCEDNATSPLGSQTFFSHLRMNEQTYGIRSSRAVPIGNGLYARGYTGIRILLRM